MKAIHVLAIAGFPLVLCGCLYGQCMDGACSLERAALIKSIKPYMEHWTKPGMTAQSRLADWLACGGDRDGGFSYDIKTNSLPTETQAETQKRVKGNFQRCLIKHGYRYAGCDQGLFQGEPICGG